MPVYSSGTPLSNSWLSYLCCDRKVARWLAQDDHYLAYYYLRVDKPVMQRYRKQYEAIEPLNWDDLQWLVPRRMPVAAFAGYVEQLTRQAEQRHGLQINIRWILEQVHQLQPDDCCTFVARDGERRINAELLHLYRTSSDIVMFPALTNIMPPWLIYVSQYAHYDSGTYQYVHETGRDEMAYSKLINTIIGWTYNTGMAHPYHVLVYAPDVIRQQWLEAFAPLSAEPKASPGFWKTCRRYNCRPLVQLAGLHDARLTMVVNSSGLLEYVYEQPTNNGWHTRVFSSQEVASLALTGRRRLSSDVIMRFWRQRHSPSEWWEHFSVFDDEHDWEKRLYSLEPMPTSGEDYRMLGEL